MKELYHHHVFLHRSWNAVEDVPSELKGRLSGFLKRGETDLSIGLNRMKELAELRIRQAFAMRRAYFYKLLAHERP
ncbi:hypothetical protein ACFS3C_19085 [Azotobacter vinelandii]